MKISISFEGEKILYSHLQSSVNECKYGNLVFAFSFPHLLMYPGDGNPIQSSVSVCFSQNKIERRTLIRHLLDNLIKMPQIEAIKQLL